MRPEQRPKESTPPAPPPNARSADEAPFRHAEDRVTNSGRKHNGRRAAGYLMTNRLCPDLRPMFVRASSAAPARTGLMAETRLRDPESGKADSVRSARVYWFSFRGLYLDLSRGRFVDAPLPVAALVTSTVTNRAANQSAHFFALTIKSARYLALCCGDRE
jgi:hypothetical protein